MTPEVSIVLGTYNRYPLLVACIKSIGAAVGDLRTEIIVVDAGSTDGSRGYSAVRPDVVLLAERGLYGACDAYNKGFRLARAPFVVHLNDDDICHPGIIKIAYDYMWHHPDVGQIAFPFRDCEQGGYGTGMALGLPYANKGMTRKWLGDFVGWWGTDYHKYAGDNELSVNIWMCGYKVVMLKDCKVEHHLADNKLREMSSPNKDSAKFYAKWGRGCLHPPGSPAITEKEARDVIDTHNEALLAYLRFKQGKG